MQFNLSMFSISFRKSILTEWIENKQGMIDYIAIAQNKLEKIIWKRVFR